MSTEEARHFAQVRRAQFHVVVQEGYQVRTRIHRFQAPVPLDCRSQRRGHEQNAWKSEGVRQDVVQTWTYDNDLPWQEALTLNRAHGIVEDCRTPNGADNYSNLHIALRFTVPVRQRKHAAENQPGSLRRNGSPTPNQRRTVRNTAGARHFRISLSRSILRNFSTAVLTVRPEGPEPRHGVNVKYS